MWRDDLTKRGRMVVAIGEQILIGLGFIVLLVFSGWH